MNCVYLILEIRGFIFDGCVYTEICRGLPIEFDRYY